MITVYDDNGITLTAVSRSFSFISVYVFHHVAIEPCPDLRQDLLFLATRQRKQYTTGYREGFKILRCK